MAISATNNGLRFVILLLCLALPLTAAADGSNWLAAVPGNLLLTRLSIPGTHDAGALHEPFPGTTTCQTLTLAEQLDVGVRFLDIRCRHIHDSFDIHHGRVYQHLNFDNVLNTVFTFLTNNPSETVIMSVKPEYEPQDNTRSFEATFDAYVAKNPTRWWLKSTVPTLDEARGKIVLFRRFGAEHTPKGLDLSVWPDNATFTNGNVRVQDDYEVTNNAAKWNAITNLLTAAQTGDRNTLYVNFTSGVGRHLLLPSIPYVADAISPQLTNYLAAHPRARYGVILLDFADANKCRLIYQSSP